MPPATVLVARLTDPSLVITAAVATHQTPRHRNELDGSGSTEAGSPATARKRLSSFLRESSDDAPHQYATREVQRCS